MMTTSWFRLVLVVVLLLVVPPWSPGGHVVEAWGTAGHEIVGNLAWTLVSPSTREMITTILNISTTTSHDDCLEYCSPLAVVADWADRVRYYEPWTAPLHFIDVQDDAIAGGCPVAVVVNVNNDNDNDNHNNNHNHNNNANDHHLQQQQQPVADDADQQCQFIYARDCVDNVCVAGAILNYTKALSVLRRRRQRRGRMPNEDEEEEPGSYYYHHDPPPPPESSRTTNNDDGYDDDDDHQLQRQHQPHQPPQQLHKEATAEEALKFVVHFVGDIHQVRSARVVFVVDDHRGLSSFMYYCCFVGLFASLSLFIVVERSLSRNHDWVIALLYCFSNINLAAAAPALFAENRQGGQFDSFESRRLAKTTRTTTGGGDDHTGITAPFAAQ
jgi:S1/P1 Nuclease